MMKSTKNYWLVAYKSSGTKFGNVLRVQDGSKLTALSQKEINEGIRQILDEDRRTYGDSFCVTNISYLGEMPPEVFGDVNSWQQPKKEYRTQL